MPLVLPSNPDLHMNIYTRLRAVHLQQFAGEEPLLRGRHVSATACINSDQRETYQRYVNRPDDTTVSALSVAQPRPAIYQPQT